MGWRKRSEFWAVIIVRHTMLKEYHYDHLIRWPNGERAAVFLTFDFQGGEDVKPDKNGILNYESWSQGEHGFVFNTNCFHEELSFLWEKDGKLLVELPRQPFGDGTLFGHRHGEYGNPYHGLETWKAYFDELYSESSRERPKYIPFTMHPYIIGRPGRTLALRGIIAHMKKAGNLWFPTGAELAEWCLNNAFQAECQKLRASAG